MTHVTCGVQDDTRARQTHKLACPQGGALFHGGPSVLAASRCFSGPRSPLLCAACTSYLLWMKPALPPHVLRFRGFRGMWSDAGRLRSLENPAADRRYTLLRDRTGPTREQASSGSFTSRMLWRYIFLCPAQRVSRWRRGIAVSSVTHSLVCDVFEVRIMNGFRLRIACSNRTEETAERRRLTYFCSLCPDACNSSTCWIQACLTIRAALQTL